MRIMIELLTADGTKCDYQFSAVLDFYNYKIASRLGVLIISKDI